MSVQNRQTCRFDYCNAAHSTCFQINIEPIQTVTVKVSRPSGRVARPRPQGVCRGTRSNYVTRTRRVRLTFAMSIYGIALVDGHGNVGHRFTGSGRESDRCDRDHSCQCFHFVFFLVGWRPNRKEINEGRLSWQTHSTEPAGSGATEMGKPTGRNEWERISQFSELVYSIG